MLTTIIDMIFSNNKRKRKSIEFLWINFRFRSPEKWASTLIWEVEMRKVKEKSFEIIKFL